MSSITLQEAIDILYRRQAGLTKEVAKGVGPSTDYKRGLLSGLGQALRLLSQVGEQCNSILTDTISGSTSSSSEVSSAFPGSMPNIEVT